MLNISNYKPTAIELNIKKTYTLSHEELNVIIKLAINLLNRDKNTFSCTALDNAIVKVYHRMSESVTHEETSDKFLNELRRDYHIYLLKTYTEAEISIGVTGIDKFKRIDMIKDFHKSIIKRNAKYRCIVIEDLLTKHIENLKLKLNKF